MIKFALAALWIIAVTAGTMLYGNQSGGNGEETAGGVHLSRRPSDYVQTEVISVPVLRDNEVYGYFLPASSTRPRRRSCSAW